MSLPQCLKLTVTQSAIFSTDSELISAACAPPMIETLLPRASVSPLNLGVDAPVVLLLAELVPLEPRPLPDPLPPRPFPPRPWLPLPLPDEDPVVPVVGVVVDVAPFVIVPRSEREFRFHKYST